MLRIAQPPGIAPNTAPRWRSDLPALLGSLLLVAALSGCRTQEKAVDGVPRRPDFAAAARRPFDSSAAWHIESKVGCGADSSRLVDSISYGNNPALRGGFRDTAGDRALEELTARGLAAAVGCDGKPVFVERLPDGDGWFGYYRDPDGKTVLGYSKRFFVAVDTDRLIETYPNTP